MLNADIKYSPSINIIRDSHKELDYIVTPNSVLVYDQLINNYLSGTHSFNIVGAYGTGKSSFLVALKHHLSNEHKYFAALNGNFTHIKGFDFLPIIGDYSSLYDTFCKEFGLVEDNYSSQDLFNLITKRYESICEKSFGWYIAIDEFGKFLEYAAKNNPEKELYFIQQLAEFVNDNSKNIIFITTLHQGFNSYSLNLNKTQQNEWDKVKGRLKEITYNEPVEQLLLLAADRISSKREKSVKSENLNQLLEIIEKSKTFPLNDYFDKSTAQKLLPFDILAASALTIAFQRYGQNERSLFQFIDSNDHLGLSDFDKDKNQFYNLCCVYDYLWFNYFTVITSKYNPDYGQWATIRNSIERIESEFSSNTIEAIRIVKTIGLINILANPAGVVDKTFLSEYSRLSLDIENSSEIIDKLISFKIISFSKYNRRFKLLDGTDLDIEQEIFEAEIENINDYIPYLKRYFEFPYIQAKEHFYQTGTPRFFEFKLTEKPLNESVEDSDGIINLIFSDEASDANLIELSDKIDEPILYCLYLNAADIKNHINEIEKVNVIKDKHPNDKVAQKELEILLMQLKSELNGLVLSGLYEKNSVIWVFRGNQIFINNERKLNQTLSNICAWAYPGTPVFKNELVNKTKLSGAMQPARKNLIKALVSDYDKPNLGFDNDKFPPEKTIYLALLKKTGIHQDTVLSQPIDPSFMTLWGTCINFINEAKSTRISISVLIERLSKRPLKLRQGFIDFWVPLFLFICKDDFALYNENGYIPDIDDETLFLISKQPQEFEIKAFDISGIKLDLFNSYRTFLNIEETDNVTNESFIELIKPFLVFYLQLPDYNKKTKRISKMAIDLRNAIALSKDPEKTFFEDIPNALGIQLDTIAKDPTLVKKYIDNLQALVREIRSAYEELINRIEDFILTEFIGENIPFVEYKSKFQHRYMKLKKHMLLPKQKVFHQRLMSELDIRNSWINSICQAVIGKSLEIITDEDEMILYENFKSMVYELDNLCTLVKTDINLDNEDVYKFEVTTFLKGLQKQILRIPKGKLKEIKSLEDEIKSKLTSNDKSMNIALLLNLLQDQIDEK
ncbi:MAG: hypothetical protein H6Q17_469 [Bacteroidetes bacterium]|nr:hypothetical protein [Bacteroidota bacterium]